MRTQKLAHPVPTLEIDTLYEQELKTLNEELRRQAARSLFYKLQPQNRTTVEQFISELRQHKEVWAEVANLGILDFAHAVLGDRRHSGTEEKLSGKRTRLSDEQKESLKDMILHILAAHKEGLNRNEIAKNFSVDQIDTLHIGRSELSNKLRQPLAELVTNRRIHSLGTKRLLKYFLGTEGSSSRGKNSKGL